MTGFYDMIGPLLDREGGYVNHKSDRGGATNKGITQATYSQWRGNHGMSWRDVSHLTTDEAEKIYRELYWIPARCDDVPELIRELHFDAAVNHGVTRASKLLQEAAGVEQDGRIGPKTLEAVGSMDQALLKARYVIARYKFYGAIINRDRSQLAFIAGWLARMAHFS